MNWRRFWHTKDVQATLGIMLVGWETRKRKVLDGLKSSLIHCVFFYLSISLCVCLSLCVRVCAYACFHFEPSKYSQLSHRKSNVLIWQCCYMGVWHYTGEWLQYDDDKVSPVDEEKVLQLSGGGMSLLNSQELYVCPLHFSTRSIIYTTLLLLCVRWLAYGLYSSICPESARRKSIEYWVEK